MNERMNIKITDFLRKEINNLIKEGCGVGEFTVVELKRKIKYRNLPDKEEITFVKKDYKIYERMIEDDLDLNEKTKKELEERRKSKDFILQYFQTF